MIPGKCFYCDRVAVVLCDFLAEATADAAQTRTCDRPVCNEHRKKVGHFCYRRKNKKASDTIDYCKEHAAP